MDIIPRIYQVLAVKAGLEGLRGAFKRALVVMATGLGKTFTAAFITKEMKPKRVLFLVHNNHILTHAFKQFRLVLGPSVNMVTYNGMSKNGAQEAEIVFATWQTMSKNLNQWAKDYFDLIIVDEAHHSEAETYRPVADYFIGAKLGITATPDRTDDEEDIRSIFGIPVINITLEEAIAHGWLPRIEYHVVTDQTLNEGVLQKITEEIREGKRFTLQEVNRRIFIQKHDEAVASIIDDHQEKAVVFCTSIKHADRMTKFLINARAFHSKVGKTQKQSWSKNQETLEALETGTIHRVCAVDAFNEGVDVPSIGLVAFCRATDALRIFHQQLGRGLRAIDRVLGQLPPRVAVGHEHDSQRSSS